MSIEGKHPSGKVLLAAVAAALPSGVLKTGPRSVLSLFRLTLRAGRGRA
jgi:hypothetical protein